MATREIEQKVKLELDNERAQEQLNAFEDEGTEYFEHESECDLRTNIRDGATRKQDTVSNLSGETSGNRNLSETLEFAMIHLEINADYLRQAEPRTESRGVPDLLKTDGTRIKKVHGR